MRSPKPKRARGSDATLLCHGVDHVCLDGCRAAVPQRLQIRGFDARPFCVAHLLDRPAIARTKHHGPPILGGLELLLAVLRCDLSVFDSALRQKLAQGVWSRDALPGTDGREKIGTELLHRRPERLRTRLEHAWPPGGDGELSAWSSTRHSSRSSVTMSATKKREKTEITASNGAQGSRAPSCQRAASRDRQNSRDAFDRAIE